MSAFLKPFWVIVILTASACSPFKNFSDIDFLSFTEKQPVINDKGSTDSLKQSSLIEWDFQQVDQISIEKYEVSIGTAPGANDTMDWLNVGLDKTFRYLGALNPSTTYYVNVRYKTLSSPEPSRTYSSSGFTTPPNAVDMIATSGAHSCAVNRIGGMKCWGDNYYGQLGYDDQNDRGGTIGSMASLPEVNVGAGRTVKSVSLGPYHTCAILDNGELKCWGANWWGQLGYDDTITRGDTSGSMASLAAVNVGVGRSVKSVALGMNHTCAILDNDDLKCWGNNADGQLGYDDLSGRSQYAGSMAALTAVNVGPGRTVKSVSLGYAQTCAILDDESLKCWGWNYFGQLGYDDNVNHGYVTGGVASMPPVYMGSGRTVKSVVLGLFHTCAILDDDSLKCWGANWSGELGYDDNTIRGATTGSMATLTPIDVGSARKVKSIALGQGHTCAILDDDSLKCWGANWSGQLGYDDNTSRGDTIGSMSQLLRVNVAPGRKVKSAALGGDHTCAILDDSELKCWGGNGHGQLGYDDLNTRGDGGNGIFLWQIFSNLYLP